MKVRNVLRKTYLKILIQLKIWQLRRLGRVGLHKYVHIIPAKPSAKPLSQRQALNKLHFEMFRVPNISGFYHGIMRDWWEDYGLGNNCLLISESIRTRQAFSSVYPLTSFISTDYYVDLQPDDKTDVLWDICSREKPGLLQRGFDSILCQATLEHVFMPSTALENFSSLLNPAGKLYLHTHTPCFYYHAWPRDYYRFWPDWFKDVGNYIPGLRLLELLCISGHAFAVYEKVDR
jgi:hypothetical protein